MPIDFRQTRVDVPKGRNPNGTQWRAFKGTVTFDRDVRRAESAIQTFRLDYTDSDHHINLIQVETDVSALTGNNVDVDIRVFYSDKNYDDPYQGWVDILVIAETG
jgi:hypothetical protein